MLDLADGYIEIGKAFSALAVRAVDSESLVDFAAKKSSVAKPKQCSKGFSCGLGCVSKEKTCANPLAGQAKTYAGWLKLQIKAGAKLSDSQQKDADDMGLKGKAATTKKPTKETAVKKSAKTPTAAKPAATAKPTALDSDGFPSDEALDAAISSSKTSEKLKTNTFNKGGIYRATVDGKEYFIKRPKKPQSVTAEVVVFELAKRFGLEDDVVPVKGALLKGESHVVSPFVKLDDFYAPKQVVEKIDPKHLDRERALKLATFDFIVGQTDRHLGNVALTDGKIKLIDNEFAVSNSFNKNKYFGAGTVRFNAFYEHAVFLDWAATGKGQPTAIDKEVARKAIQDLSESVALMKSRWLETKGYEKRIKLLEKVINSSDPTFENLMAQMKEANYF